MASSEYTTTDAELMRLRSKFLKNATTVGLTCVPFSGGQPKSGVESGPTEMLRYGMIAQIEAMGYRVSLTHGMDKYHKLKPAHDPHIGKMKNPKYVSLATQAVASQVRAQCTAGNVAVTLGGDHSIAIGTVLGSAAVYPDIGLIWVDAHADINTPASTDSGNLHGCPLSFLVRGVMECGRNPRPFDWVEPCIDPARLVYIGLRDVDAAEKVILRKHGIKAFSMHDVDKHGIGNVVQMAIDHLGDDRPIHLSFDVDAMDPEVAPATGTPVRGGLTFREGHYICEAVAQTGALVAVDLVEVNPMLSDPEGLGKTVAVACSIIRCCLGESLL